MKWKRLLLAAAFAGLTSITLSAATLGSFSLSGDIFVNGISSITWQSTGGVASEATVSDATGIYASLNGDTVTIETLNSSTAPVTTTSPGFSDITFIVFPAISGLMPLDINTLFAGIDTAAACGNPPTSGPPSQVCTPTVFPPSTGNPTGASFVNFENNPPPTSITSTASFAMSGDVNGTSADGTWFANFTSQFTVPFQTVLAELGPSGTGTVTDAFSASFTVSSPATTTPETSTLSMFGLGLGLVLLARSRSLIARMRRQG
jgi:hypothetical protein